jgi:UDP-N-acetylmuramoyl-tripeptide--D-alanyl-D-alanine ligase
MTISEIHALFLKSHGVCTDTRNITKNCLFIALKGANFDGNKFAYKAIESGARYALVDDTAHITSNQIILVSNTLETLQQLANYHRRFLNIPIVALTGSNGKTTTKELIAKVLSKKYNTVATIGNLNNHIGVPLTLLSMNKTTDIGIVEMGANHLKEIELLASIAEPDYGYITNFGKAHLEGFGGLEGVIKGKSELYAFLEKTNGKAFVNPNDSIQQEKTQNLTSLMLNSNARILSSNPFLEIQYNTDRLKTNLIGAYNFSNILAAISIGEYFQVAKKDIQTAIFSYIPSNNRSQIVRKGSHTILLDAYNANPSSMKVALENFSQMNAHRKNVVLGDMFELGTSSDDEHQKIATFAELLPFAQVILIGEHFSKVKTSKASKYLNFEAFKISFKTDSSSTYLIKGSRGMALERIVALFD